MDCTSHRLNTVLTWSLNVCATGIMPWLDWEGQPWPKDSWQALHAGQRLAGDYIFAFTELLSDWKYPKEEFRLQMSYAHTQICTQCFAAKSGEFIYSDCRRNAAHRLSRRSHQDFMNQYIDQLLPAFCSILGFHSSMLKYDYMHCMYLGVMAIVIGNILQELVKERAFVASLRAEDCNRCTSAEGCLAAVQGVLQDEQHYKQPRSLHPCSHWHG